MPQVRRPTVHLLVVVIISSVTMMVSCNPGPSEPLAMQATHQRAATRSSPESATPHSGLTDPRPATAPTVAPTATPAPSSTNISMAAWLNMDMCERAINRFGVPVPASVRVDCLGPRPDVSGYAHPGTGLIEIFWRPSWTLNYGMSVLGHELAHQYDFETITYQDRERWKQMRGLEGMAWRGCTECNDFYTPAGDFAEAFVLAFAPDHERGNYSKLGGDPTPEQVEFIRRIVDRASQ